MSYFTLGRPVLHYDVLFHIRMSYSTLGRPSEIWTSMKNNSSEAHPGSLPREGALKTKINGCKSLRKIGAKSSSFNMTGFLDVSLITANKKESTFLLLTVKVVVNLVSYLIEARDFCFTQCKYCLVFSKGKKTIYNNYKCFMGKQWLNKAIWKGSTWERTKKVIP